MELIKSDKIATLVQALRAAKKEIHPVIKDAQSHHGKYADLSLIEAFQCGEYPELYEHFHIGSATSLRGKAGGRKQLGSRRNKNEVKNTI